MDDLAGVRGVRVDTKSGNNVDTGVETVFTEHMTNNTTPTVTYEQVLRAEGNADRYRINGGSLMSWVQAHEALSVEHKMNPGMASGLLNEASNVGWSLNIHHDANIRLSALVAELGGLHTSLRMLPEASAQDDIPNAVQDALVELEQMTEDLRRMKTWIGARRDGLRIAGRTA